MNKRFWMILFAEMRKNTFLKYLIFFVTAFVLFYFLHDNNVFPDPDSFYHAKIAVLMSENGIVKDFPWLQYTILKDNYADHHLLYHVMIMPFVWFLPPLVGLKLATLLFASAAIVFFYWFLRSMNVKGAWFYSAVLMLSPSFIFRLNLAKAQSLALIAFFVGFFLIERRKYFWLLLFSFLYVWLYGGWPLLVVVAFFYIISDLGNIIEKPAGFSKKWRLSGKKLMQKIYENLPLLTIILAGLLAGIVINPYFPRNLIFYWNQIFKIAVINYKNVIGVGAEWGSYGVPELVASSSIVFIVFIVAVTFFVFNFKNQNRRSISLFLLTALFLALTIKSRRNVEYLIPLMLSFSGVSLTLFSKTVDIKNFFKELEKFLFEKKFLLIGVALPVFVAPYIIFRDYNETRKEYQNGQEYDKFKAASLWLKKNSAQGDIVFHSDWDEFPLLFYHNHHNYYIVGLDPTFMYSYNPDLHKKWESVTLGREIKNIYQIVKEDFKAKFVFVSLNRHEPLDNNLKDNFLFQEVYKDDKVKIYKVL